MGEPVDTGIPRFTAVPGGNGDHYSAGDDRTPGPRYSANRRKHHRNTRMAALAAHHTYRLRVSIFSGAAFLATTGFSIYKAVGR